jgi:hypothetical protein
VLYSEVPEVLETKALFNEVPERLYDDILVLAVELPEHVAW